MHVKKLAHHLSQYEMKSTNFTVKYEFTKQLVEVDVSNAGCNLCVSVLTSTINDIRDYIMVWKKAIKFSNETKT